MGVISAITGIFRNKKAENNEQRSTLVNPEQWFLDWINGGASVAGQKVNPETALKVSAVYAATNLLCRTMASLSFAEFRKLPGGGSVEVNTPESFTACVEPSDLYTSYDFRSTAMLHICLRGNFYAQLKFDRSGRVSGMTILNPDHVTPYLYKDKLYYRVSKNDGSNYVLMSGEVIHLKNFSDDGIIGKSPLTYARENIGMALAANDYASAMYENGGGLRGIIESNAHLNDKQVQDLRKNFLDVMRNYRETGSIGVLQNNAKFTQIAISPKDAQFIESAKLTVADIARFFGVPLHLIGDLERSTNNNIEHQSIEFVMHTVRPIVKSWESEYNRKCIRKSERPDHFFRFNLESLLRGDSSARAQYYSQMLNTGVYNIDEVRALENMNPIADGMGQKHYIQVNMTTLDALNAQADAAGAGSQNSDTNDKGATQGAN